MPAMPRPSKAPVAPAWLQSALDYIPIWLAFQMRASEQPGCLIAIARRGRIVLEQAFGCADLSRSMSTRCTRPLTPLAPL
jgi:hypothetical protein